MLRADATGRRVVYIRVPPHARHCWETIFLLVSGSPKAELSAEGRSCVLCVVPYNGTQFGQKKRQQGWQKPLFAGRCSN